MKRIIFILVLIVLISGCDEEIWKMEETEEKEPLSKEKYQVQQLDEEQIVKESVEEEEGNENLLRRRIRIHSNNNPKDSIFSVIPEEHRTNFKEYSDGISIDFTEIGLNLFNQNELIFNLSGSVYFYSLLDPSEVPIEPKIPYIDEDIYEVLEKEDKTYVLMDGKGTIDYDDFFDLSIEEKNKLIQQSKRLRGYTEFECTFYLNPGGGHSQKGEGTSGQVTKEQLEGLSKLSYAKSIYLPLSLKSRQKILGTDRNIIIVTNSREFDFFRVHNISDALFFDFRIIHEFETGINKSDISLGFYPNINVTKFSNDYSEYKISDLRIYEGNKYGYGEITREGLEKIKRDKRVQYIKKPTIITIA